MALGLLDLDARKLAIGRAYCRAFRVSQDGRTLDALDRATRHARRLEWAWARVNRCIERRLAVVRARQSFRAALKDMS